MNTPCQHCTTVDRRIFHVSVYCEDNPDVLDMTLMLCDECIQDTVNKLKHYVNDKDVQRYKYKNLRIK